MTDRLGQMALAGPAGPDKQRIISLGNEATRRQFKDKTAIHLRVEAEIESIERPVNVAEAGLLAPARQQPIAAARQFVGDETREQIDRRHGLDLRLV
ncbi:MAG: hypothetical protein SFV54_15595 [Bryobacteraceae bacterium]|nr:hypothetical protein [Bryobacteraceae bacterium]